MAMTVLLDGRLATGAEDQSIRVWDASTGRATQILTAHNSDTWALCALPDGNLASGANNSNVYIWDVASGTIRLTFTGHTNYVRNAPTGPP